MTTHLVINSLFIFGVHAATRDGMIFDFVAKFANKWILRVFLRVYGDGKPTGGKIKKKKSQVLIEYYETDEIRDSTEKAAKSTNFILKPLFDCPPCMASVWGIPFALPHGFNLQFFVYLVALCGLNYIVMKIISR